MRWRHGTAALLVVLGGLLACGGGEQDRAEREAAAGPKAEEAFPGAGEVAVTLAPGNQSGVRGKAVIGRRGDSLRVRLMLQGLTPGASYPAHVHEGTCAAGGSVATPLGPVAARESTGVNATAVPASAVAPDGAYFLQAHLPDGTPAACGDVPPGAFGSFGGT